MIFYSLVMLIEVGRNFSLVGLFVEMKCESAVVCFIVAVNISIATESDYYLANCFCIKCTYN